METKLAEARSPVRDEPALRVKVRVKDFVPRGEQFRTHAPRAREGDGVSAP